MEENGSQDLKLNEVIKMIFTPMFILKNRLSEINERLSRLRYIMLHQYIAVITRENENEITKMSSVYEAYEYIADKINSTTKSFNKEIKAYHIERAFVDMKVYDYSVCFEDGEKGHIHLCHGDDGCLQYVHICTDCGTFIINDHSEDYQYNPPSLMCPVCNKLRDPAKYPFQWVPRSSIDWIKYAGFYGRIVRKNLMTYAERKKLYRAFDNYQDKFHFYAHAEFIYWKSIFTRFTSIDKQFGECLRWVKLGWM